MWLHVVVYGQLIISVVTCIVVYGQLIISVVTCSCVWTVDYKCGYMWLCMDS